MGFVTGYSGFFNPAQQVEIAAGGTESDPINTGGMCLTGIILPSLFTGTALTFLVGDSLDGFQATGQAVFGGTCTDGDTLTVNGFVMSFVDTVVDPETEIEIGGTAEETLDNLIAFLDATADEDLLACTYAKFGTNLLFVQAVEHGTGGNAFTFAKSSSNITLTPSGGTLTGGGFRALYNASNAQVSMTVAAGRAYAVDPANFQGVSYLKLKSGTTETATRNIVCSLKGF